MANSKECFSGSLSMELEDLQRAHSFAAEEHEKNMRIHRLQTVNRIRELAHKVAAQEKLNLENEAEKARHLKEKLEAQRLLTLVKGQLELQEAQETQQVELIQKRKEERVKFELLLQEQWLESQAHLRQQYESKLAVELLEEKLKDLKEDIDYKDDLINTLAIFHRQANDEVEDARTTILSSDFLGELRTADLGVKNVGELSDEGWYEVCGNKFKSSKEFFEWRSEIDRKLRSPGFVPPLKSVPDGNNGRMKYAIDEDDKWLTELREKFGPVVADSVGAAALEIENWNPSGRRAIEMPWDYRLNKKATLGSIFYHLFKMLELKARTDATSSRKRTRWT